MYRRHRRPNLASLAAQLPAALDGLTAELVVTLNGVPEEAVGAPPGTTYARFERNEGVPIAWNAAVRRSVAPILCIVNDDVVLREGALRCLYAALVAREDAGVVGPVGTRWDLSAARHCEYVRTMGAPDGTLVECDVVSGFLLMTPREVFDRAGGFDEAYTPCGFEEVDYCTTVRRRLGLRCYAVAGVAVKHSFGISAKRSWRRIRYQDTSATLGEVDARNRRHFIDKWSTTAAVEPA